MRPTLPPITFGRGEEPTLAAEIETAVAVQRIEDDRLERFLASVGPISAGEHRKTFKLRAELEQAVARAFTETDPRQAMASASFVSHKFVDLVWRWSLFRTQFQRWAEREPPQPVRLESGAVLVPKEWP